MYVCTSACIYIYDHICIMYRCVCMYIYINTYIYIHTYRGDRFQMPYRSESW